jgi:16S rRNA (guanine527-N7)-methyltransferase
VELERLRAGAATFNVALSDKQLEEFAIYSTLLRAANTRTNLVSQADPETVLVSHILDSLSCLVAVEIEAGQRIIDVGSGAGLPGIPLAITRPEADFVLLDSSDKRTRFLNEARNRLNLRNVEIVGLRAEEAGRETRLRDGFDLAVARAVAPLPTLVEFALPFVKAGGTFVAMRGPKAEVEVIEAQPAIFALSASLIETQAVTVPWLNAERRLVVMRKTGPTPSRYPRRTGVPAKRPL